MMQIEMRDREGKKDKEIKHCVDILLCIHPRSEMLHINRCVCIYVESKLKNVFVTFNRINSIPHQFVCCTIH